ncbi:MAG: type III pantothenate kinase [Defluviitaleaceae bacterium]|nr:type III pantothenate kinase [Defluviitaleaceae bacterium]
MLLVIDVGNTNIVLGLYMESKLVKSWRMATAENRSSDEIGLFIYSLFGHAKIPAEQLKNIIISSVVPNIMYSLTNGIRKYFDVSPVIVNSDMKLGITLNEESRRELGADRIVNCVAAYQFYGGPIIVIDYGTATTYDVISKNGEFLTGITAPGIKISADALFARAALLGKVELALPDSMVVTSTVESVQAGILYGRVGETEYIVNRLKEELGMPDSIVVATGGLAHTIARGTGIFDHIVPALTLEGLRLLFEMNVGE